MVGTYLAMRTNRDQWFPFAVARPLALALSILLLSSSLQGHAGGFTFPVEVMLGDLTGTNGFRLNGVADGDRSGWSVSGTGDVNGDGINDFIIGAPGADMSGNSDAGSTYVVFGRDTATEGNFPGTLTLGDLTGTHGFRIDGEAVDDRSGWSVSGTGDVNGDGIDDLIVGAAEADPNGNLGSGSSYVVFGRNTTTEGEFPATIALGDLTGTNGFRMDGGAEFDSSGWPVSAAGDINGDGIDDLIIGDSGADPDGNSGAGSSYVVFGRNTTTEGEFPATIALGDLTGTNGFRMDGEPATNDFGAVSVSAAGDINGDGIDDLIIGDSGADPDGNSGAGSSYVVFGRNTTTEGEFPATIALGDLTGTNGFRMDGGAEFDGSGSVSGAGDVNGDGIDDLIVAASGANSAAGSVYVVFGRDTSNDGVFPARLALAELSGTEGFRMDVEASFLSNQTRASAAGDINGDGIDDLIVGAPGADWNGALSGRSYVVFGRNTETAGTFSATLALGDLTGTDGFRMDGESAYDFFGASVGDAGDINGDGINDLVIGAPRLTPDNQSDAGSSYIIFGGITGPGAIPEMTLAPANLDFGDVMIGGVAGATLIVENTGTGLLETSLLSLQGMHAGDFSIEQNGCAGAQLAGGEFCDIEVGFSPTAPGIREATLRAESNALTSPDRAALRGSNDVVFANEFE